MQQPASTSGQPLIFFLIPASRGEDKRLQQVIVWRAIYEPVGETICKPFTGARVALPVPGVAVKVKVAAVRLRKTM